MTRNRGLRPARMRRFCLYNHDTWELGGRSKCNGCKRCSRIRSDEAVRKQKLWAITHKGEYCLDCGFDFKGRPECAQFDHRNGRTISQGVSITRLSRVRLLQELEQCDLVCANCHMTRTKNRQESRLSRPEKEAVLSGQKGEGYK